MSFNIKKLWAIKEQAKKCLQGVPQKPGIYVWTRQEDKFTYFYVGQAKNLQNRMIDYYLIKHGATWPKGMFQCSLKKHKDYMVDILEICDESKLDEREKYWFNEYLGRPFHITRNSTTGGQHGTKKIQEHYQSPKKQKNAFRAQVNETLIKSLDQLEIEQTEAFLRFTARKNKSGEYNKTSLKALRIVKMILLGDDE